MENVLWLSVMEANVKYVGKCIIMIIGILLNKLKVNQSEPYS